jgi:preprotein translocase subunit SecE
MGVRVPPPLPGFVKDTSHRVRASEKDFMATQAVKVKNEESPNNAITGVAGDIGKKVTGSLEGTREFLHDVRVEMKQVTWPNRDDVVSTTSIVIATVAFFGFFLYIVENLAQMGLDRLLRYFHV